MAAGRRIAGITIEIDGNTTKLTKALAEVDKSLKNTSTQLKDIDKLLQIKPTSTELLTQKQKALQKSITDTKQRLQELKNVQKDSVSPEQWDAVQREIAETEGKLKSLNKEYQQFGSVGAQQVAAVGEKMKEVGGTMVSAGQTMTTHVTVPIVAGLGASQAKFAEVDKTMQLTNSTMGNTAEQAALLDAAMKEAAGNSTYSMNDAATATLNFARAGLDAQQAADALAPAMNLAAGEGGNLDIVSGGLVATINGFHGSFEQAGMYADVFANACNNSALDVDGLSHAMSVAAPIFSAAGYSVNDAALYMGVMANAGIDADKAANSLKTGLARLVSPAKEGSEMMEKLGISVTDSDGHMNDSVTIQKELHDAFGKLSESEQIAAASAIFGKNQMAPWLALINTAPGDVGNLSTALEQQGTASQMASDMMGGYGGSIEKLKSSVDVLMTSLGQVVAQFLQPIIDKAQEVVDWFNKLDSGQQKIVVTIALVVAAIGPLLMIVGNMIIMIGQVMTYAPMISTAITAVSGGFAGLTAAAGGLATSIAGVVAPFLPFIAIAALVVAAGVLIYKNWDTIKAWAKKLADGVKAAFNALKQGVMTALNAVKQFCITTWNNIKTQITTTVNAIKTVVTTVWNAIKTAINTVINAIKSVVTTGWNAIKTGVTTAVNAIKTVVTTVWNAIKTAITTVVNAIKTAAMSAFNGMKSGITSVVNGIKSVVTSAFNAAKNAIVNPINSAKNTVKSAISAMSRAFSGAKFKFPKIKLPHFSWTMQSIAGIVKVPKIHVSWYRKAYDNPYLFNSPTVMNTSAGLKGFGDGNGGEIVYGRKQLMRDISEAAGGEANYTVNVYAAPGMDVNTLAQKVQDKFVQWQRQKEAAYA